jgi:hypothetical protein
MHFPWHATRAFLVAMLLVCASAPVSAQDPRESAVSAASRDWLAIIDKGDYAASWKAAGTKFRSAITAEKWSESVTAVRGPLGKVVQRTGQRTTFTKEFPGVPQGDYALVNFLTAFEKRTDTEETLTLEREADGQWHVIGYFIR